MLGLDIVSFRYMEDQSGPGRLFLELRNTGSFPFLWMLEAGQLEFGTGIEMVKLESSQLLFCKTEDQLRKQGEILCWKQLQ